jgi:hypothetical protein
MKDTLTAWGAKEWGGGWVRAAAGPRMPFFVKTFIWSRLWGFEHPDLKKFGDPHSILKFLSLTVES